MYRDANIVAVYSLDRPGKRSLAGCADACLLDWRLNVAGQAQDTICGASPDCPMESGTITANRKCEAFMFDQDSSKCFLLSQGRTGLKLQHSVKFWSGTLLCEEIQSNDEWASSVVGPSDPLPQWTEDVITPTGINSVYDPNICNIYYSRSILMWVYKQAELQDAIGSTSAKIYGLRFFVTQQPLYQPLPNYAIGMKNVAVGTGNPGHTGYTVVKNPSSETFTTGSTKSFDLFDQSFDWDGGDLAIMFAWGQVQDTYHASGLSPTGAGTMWYSWDDDPGTYTINTDDPISTRSYRPVVQLYAQA